MAAKLRKELQVSCFSPRLRFQKATQRGTIWFVEALFPGYVFAEFVYATLHRRVRSLDGIQTIVQFGDNVAILDPAVVAMLRERTGDEEVVTINRQIEVGAAVLITEGPFRGLEAVVTQLLPAKERVRVLLEWLNRMVEIEAPLPKVLPKMRPRI